MLSLSDHNVILRNSGIDDVGIEWVVYGKYSVVWYHLCKVNSFLSLIDEDDIV